MNQLNFNCLFYSQLLRITCSEAITSKNEATEEVSEIHISLLKTQVQADHTAVQHWQWV